MAESALRADCTLCPTLITPRHPKHMDSPHPEGPSLIRIKQYANQDEQEMQNFGEISKSCSLQIIFLSRTLSVLFSTPRSSAWTTSSTNTSKHLSQMFGTVCAASQSCKYFSLNSEVTNKFRSNKQLFEETGVFAFRRFDSEYNTLF